MHSDRTTTRDLGATQAQHRLGHTWFANGRWRIIQAAQRYNIRTKYGYSECGKQYVDNHRRLGPSPKSTWRDSVNREQHQETGAPWENRLSPPRQINPWSTHCSHGGDKPIIPGLTHKHRFPPTQQLQKRNKFGLLPLAKTLQDRCVHLACSLHPLIR